MLTGREKANYLVIWVQGPRQLHLFLYFLIADEGRKLQSNVSFDSKLIRLCCWPVASEKKVLGSSLFWINVLDRTEKKQAKVGPNTFGFHVLVKSMKAQSQTHWELTFLKTESINRIRTRPPSTGRLSDSPPQVRGIIEKDKWLSESFY